jgi:hypothetical protein
MFEPVLRSITRLGGDAPDAGGDAIAPTNRHARPTLKAPPVGKSQENKLNSRFFIQAHSLYFLQMEFFLGHRGENVSACDG